MEQCALLVRNCDRGPTKLTSHLYPHLLDSKDSRYQLDLHGDREKK